MKVVFFASDKPRERILADAFLAGVKKLGDDVEMRVLTPEPVVTSDVDVACMVGVKSRELYQAYWRAGIHTLYFDKGYSRHKSESPVRGWEFWRLAVDGHHPTRHLMKIERPDDRLTNLQIDLKPWRTSGEHILFAGSSAKYHDFYGISEPTKYARKQFKHIREFSPRPIVYRPKPSWHDAVPIAGAEFSTLPVTMDDVLENCHALVTHGSNACFEAILAGIPCVIIGDAVAKPISSQDLAEIEDPRIPTDDERMQWLCNLSYFQFTMPEMAAGMTWELMRPLIYD